MVDSRLFADGNDPVEQKNMVMLRKRPWGPPPGRQEGMGSWTQGFRLDGVQAIHPESQKEGRMDIGYSWVRGRTLRKFSLIHF